LRRISELVFGWQGDQTSWLKNRPKCRPTRFFLPKLMHSLKCGKIAKKAWYFFNFQKKLSRVNNRPSGESGHAVCWRVSCITLSLCFWRGRNLITAKGMSMLYLSGWFSHPLQHLGHPHVSAALFVRIGLQIYNCIDVKYGSSPWS
jgi:hypothetical protein